ncbi:MAG: BspA family leucine-rich repeat surface protein [Longimonas sp.]|uniref:BspA family leucine-rich repeat surface protein n=1 Tax=Longimonas sp. TaxID=2039626 RepID=UPI003976E0C2
MRFAAQFLLLCCSVILLLAVTPLTAESQDAFKTTWSITESGESIFIPTAPGTAYDFTIDWGDGTTETVDGINPNPDHVYDRAGTYTVSITGTFPRIHFDASPVYPFGDGDSANAQKLQTVEQWGVTEWLSMEDAFAGAVYLRSNAEDAPDLSNVSSMDRMFAGAEFLNTDLAHWDVSNVEHMSALFANASLFNGDIEAWDVSNVEDMSGMFMHAKSFNRDIGGWDVSNVTNMRVMFAHAHAFNQDIGNWNVSNLEDMSGMFMHAKTFNQDLSSWDVSKVTKMTAMFAGTESFNQDIGSWDVSAVRNMRAMFAEAESFNQDIASWEVGNVRNLTRMFNRAETFNYDLGDWSTRNVEIMSFMFSGAQSFNQDPRNLYVPRAAIAEKVFADALLLTYNIPEITEPVDELEQLVGKERDAQIQRRFQMLWLLKSGKAKSRNAAARHLGVDNNTIADWLALYEAGGLQKIQKVGTPGPEPRQKSLPSDVLEALKERLAKPEDASSYKDIQRWLAEEHDIQLDYSTLHGIVRYEIGAKPKAARPNDPKRPTEANRLSEGSSRLL